MINQILLLISQCRLNAVVEKQAQSELERGLTNSSFKFEREYRLSPMEEEMVKGFEEKAGNPGFDTNIRVVVSAANKDIAEYKLQTILGAFAQYSGTVYANEFKNTKPSSSKHEIEHFIYRTFDEHSFVLNNKELSTLFHMPLPTTETPNIRWLLSKKAAPPFNMPKEGIILGEVEYRGIHTPVRMKRADRQRHLYVIGQTGSGKSVMLSDMAIQDIRNGEGVCVIDPHGDLVEDVLAGIPKERKDHYEVTGAGHYGIFSGRRWRDKVYPKIKTFIREQQATQRHS